MEIKEERAGDVLVLAPDGNLSTGEECHALDERLSAALGAGARFLVVDFAHVGHLTAASLRALLLASRKLARQKGRIVLCRMTPKVQKAFSISGFDRDFTVLPTREAAVTVVLQPAAAPAGRAAGRKPAAAAPAPDVPSAETPPPPGSQPQAPPQAAPATPPPQAAQPNISAPAAARRSTAADPASEHALALAARLLAALGAPPGSSPLPAAAPPSPDAAHHALAAALVHALDAQPA